MAWLSIGTSNDDLCSKLQSYSILQEGTDIMAAFRDTDRGDFVPMDDRLTEL